MQESESELDLRVGTVEGGRDGLHRIVEATVLGTSDSLARHRRGLLTGLSVVVVEREPAASAQVAAATGWAPPEYRVEFVLDDPSPEVTQRLDVGAWPWSSVVPSSGRLGALDAATAQSTGEFVIVGSSSGRDGDEARRFARLGEALGLMWVNGADALVLGGRRRLVVPDDGSQVADRRPEHLAAALGLRRGSSGGLVVLRRWVARFLFDGIDLAVDPLHEFADRVRLLELRLLEVVDPD
jgi:hypothetical protein